MYLPSRSITCIESRPIDTQSGLPSPVENTYSSKATPSFSIVRPAASFAVTLPFSTVMVPMRSGPRPLAKTMSFFSPVPKVFTPGFIGKRPASVSQPLSWRRLFSARSRHAWSEAFQSADGCGDWASASEAPSSVEAKNGARWRRRMVMIRLESRAGL